MKVILDLKKKKAHSMSRASERSKFSDTQLEFATKYQTQKQDKRPAPETREKGTKKSPNCPRKLCTLY